jgi:glycolate oxidase FAD binding subunit
MMANSIDVQSMTDELAAIVGREYVYVEDGVVSVAPSHTDEVAAVLRYANENGISVTPYGGGSKQRWGNQGSSALKIGTHRLNTVREHTWQDMTCVVEAGCSWSKMQITLAEYGQFVALDPLWPDQATVGGIVATNDSGILRHRYGSLRDLVIGMTIVLADGTVARSGGKVVKNVAGYDLHKLMTGAFGTLGFITDVAFRLHSLPSHTPSFTITSSNSESLGALMLRLLDSHLSVRAIQLRSGSDEFYLDIQLVTLPEAMREQTELMAGLAEKLNLTATDCDVSVWNKRQELYDLRDAVLFKATLLPSEIARFTAEVQAIGGDCVTQAVGVMTASIPLSAASHISRLRQQMEANRGSLTIQQQPAEVAIAPWGALPDTMALMREVKQRFDPKHILNPGRFLGEI